MKVSSLCRTYRDRLQPIGPRYLVQVISAIAAALTLTHLLQPQVYATTSDDSTRRPNILLIMVDDMGFSDLGCYGGEIQTPNIDRLASEGVRFSHFYNASRCCPTRASLMTGLHPHLTGIGHMTTPPQGGKHDASEAFPSYRGFLNRHCVTVAEMLRPAGYASFICGKWHLGMAEQDQWPLQRGFDRFYGCLSGATKFFHPVKPRHMTLDNEYHVKPVSTTDRPFYTTDAFTDKAIRFIEEERDGKDRPFFLYLSYTAPHWPHQAHEEEIAKYRGTYSGGWNSIRQRRYEKQQKIGLIKPEWKLSPRPEDVPDWESLSPEKQKEMDLRMAVYAAMVDRIDQNIGKLMQSLENSGKVDNTLVLFLSDNGACAEGETLGRGTISPPEKRNQQGANNYGSAWAHVSSTPFRLYKHYTHEGGAASPFIMYWPARIKSQSDWYDSPAQVIDIVPTLLEVAGTDYPEQAHGNPVPALRGVSLAPAFDGKSLARTSPMFSEHENNAFMMEGDWKLVGRGVATPDGPKDEQWELYDLATDRTELNDLSKSERAVARRMAAQWLQWAKDDRVYPKPTRKRGSSKEKQQEQDKAVKPSTIDVGGTSKPNIVFLFADDQRSGTLNLGGEGNNETVTPNLDALAGRGMLFRNAYVFGSDRSSVCYPSRAQLLSGKSLFHSPLIDAPSKSLDDMNLPAALRLAGYQTMRSGKANNVPYGINVEFDVNVERASRGTVEGNLGYFQDAEDFLEGKELKGLGNVRFRWDGKSPFFMYLAVGTPHAPYPRDQTAVSLYQNSPVTPPEGTLIAHPVLGNLLKKYQRADSHAEVAEELREYYASISFMDRLFGELVETIRLKGLYENTLFVFAGDNGLSIGSHGLDGKSNLMEFWGDACAAGVCRPRNPAGEKRCPRVSTGHFSDSGGFHRSHQTGFASGRIVGRPAARRNPQSSRCPTDSLHERN